MSEKNVVKQGSRHTGWIGAAVLTVGLLVVAGGNAGFGSPAAHDLQPEPQALRLVRAAFPELNATQLAGSVAARGLGAAGGARALLTVLAPARGNAALSITTRGLRFSILRVGGGWPTTAASGMRFASPAHLLAPAGAYRSTGDGWLAARVDEYQVLGHREAYAAAYNVTLPPEIRRIHDAGDYLELCRANRVPVLRFHAAVARGAGGREQVGAIQVEGLAPGGWASVRGHLRVRTFVRTTGLFAPVVVDPGWSSTRSMAEHRSHDTATLLTSGKVLVVGGTNGPRLLSSAEIYDPATWTWSAAAALATAREDHTATLLPSGEVLVVGGSTMPNSYTTTTLASAEVYDPTTDTWSSTGSLGVARRLHTATLLQSGKVLLAGGRSDTSALSSAELYDPAAGTFSATGALTNARFLHTATLLPSGKVLVAGGTTAVRLSSAELYDPATQSWSTTGALAGARSVHVAIMLRSGKVLVAGGTGNGGAGALSTAELYDPAAGTWGPTGSLSVGRSGASATLLPSGEVLVAGGTAQSGTAASTEIYDPTQGSFSAGPSMAGARTGHTATLLPSDDVLITGGEDAGGTPLSTAEIYGLTWPTTAGVGVSAATGSLSVARLGQTATLLPDGTVLIVGGDEAHATATVERYDPATGTFSSTGDLSHARGGQTTTLLENGQVLVAGGVDTNSNVLASAELYDPDTGTWTDTGSMNDARYQHTATLLESGKVLVVGGNGSSSFQTSAELYDPDTGSWSDTGSLPNVHGRDGASAFRLRSGKVLLVGGTGLQEVAIYDPAAGTWSEVPAPGLRAWEVVAAELDSGDVLVASAAGSVNQPPVPIYLLFHPDTLTWSSVGSGVVDTAYAPATVLPSGRVLVAGGGASNLQSDVVQEYEPGTGTWSEIAPLVNGRAGHTATLLPSGKVLMAGGAWGGAPLAGTTAEIYDPSGASDAWRPTVTTGKLYAGTPADIAGTGFRGSSEAGGGGTNGSASDVPIVDIRPLGGGAFTRLAGRNFSSTSVTVDVPAAFPSGYYLVEVTVNGITGGAIDQVVGDAVPVAADQSVSTHARTPLPITLAATDADFDPLTYAVVSQPANGTLSGTPPNVTYTATFGWSGPDSFTFKANDGRLDSNVATVTIDVTDTAPVADAQSVTVAENGTVQLTLTATDAENDPISYTIVSQPAHGKLSGPTPNLAYVPDTGYTGVDAFAFQASDSTLLSKVAVVSITVTNPPPVAEDQQVAAVAGVAKKITLGASDADGDTLTYAVTTLPSHGTVTGTPPSLTYTAASDFTGTDTLVFAASDGTSSASGTVTITVAAGSGGSKAASGCGCSASGGSTGPTALLLGLVVLAWPRRRELSRRRRADLRRAPR